ncbi:hypothetical protein FIBSPDRAFT_938460 [Athelia psychrophila]|uniref:Uncharacterized protein n=1 Tax=Athelia psychrophila TaxID=1759441 RepID=A0A165YFX6_9AGAM|nr:hypothetical protein FIBSPDRAFT_938460 [Fibularhizoctonia sp. CBS 109695]
MLGQNEIGKLLKRCNGDPIAIEEVLSAYVVWKYLKGRPPGHILSKLRYLTIYLQVTGQHDVLRAGSRAFTLIKTECGLGEESRIGMVPATTPVGKEVWNRIRRQMSAAQVKLVTEGLYRTTPTSGPVHTQAHAFIPANHQRTTGTGAGVREGEATAAARPQWVAQHFDARTQFGNERALPPTYGQAAPVRERVGGEGGEVMLLPMYEPRASTALSAYGERDLTESDEGEEVVLEELLRPMLAGLHVPARLSTPRWNLDSRIQPEHEVAKAKKRVLRTGLSSSKDIPIRQMRE